MIMRGKDIDLSFLCPQFVPDGMLLTLQVHGNRNSMMQNMTYNPINQDPFFLFYCYFATTFTTNYWCLLLLVFFEVFTKKFTS